MNNTVRKIAVAVLSFTGMLGVFYLVQILGMQSLSAPLEFMKDKWYFVFPLAAGFAIQMVMYIEIRIKSKKHPHAIAASASTSTGAMIACCTHNLAILLPFAGLGVLGNILFKYIDYIFVFALVVMIYSTWLLAKQYRAAMGCEM